MRTRAQASRRRRAGPGYTIDGAKCRDGSPFGVFVHWGEQTEKLSDFLKRWLDGEMLQVGP